MSKDAFISYSTNDAALRALTGKTIGDDPAQWQEWWRQAGAVVA